MVKSPQAESYFHLHLISDATGETLIAVGRAAAAQYATVSPVEHIYSLVRSPKRLDQVVAEIEANPGVVLYTLVDQELAEKLEIRCRELGVPALSVLGPVLALFRSYLGAETTPRVGGQHTLNAEYFRRIDALNFTMMHDDGQHSENLEEADVVLVGVSRTSKTPTSIYLANRGIKTANVPLVPGVAMPAQVETLVRPLVVAYASAERIVQIRQNRCSGSILRNQFRLADRQAVSEKSRFQTTARAPRLAVDRRYPPLDRGTAAAVASLLQGAAGWRRRTVVFGAARPLARIQEQSAPYAAGGGRHSGRDRSRRYR
jgi:regulator of PEP synthase PpsR (kinase-PPPase family)